MCWSHEHGLRISAFGDNLRFGQVGFCALIQYQLDAASPCFNRFARIHHPCDCGISWFALVPVLSETSYPATLPFLPTPKATVRRPCLGARTASRKRQLAALSFPSPPASRPRQTPDKIRAWSSSRVIRHPPDIPYSELFYVIVGFIRVNYFCRHYTSNKASASFPILFPLLLTKGKCGLHVIRRQDLLRATHHNYST